MMTLTKFFCVVCFLSVGHMAQGVNTETTTDDHSVLQYLQDLKEHVIRLEQRLNTQNVRILKQEETIQNQRKEFMSRLTRQEETITRLEQRLKTGNVRIVKQEERIQYQRKEFMSRITRQDETITRLEQHLNAQNVRILQQEETIQDQRKELMSRITQQEETILTLKKSCNLMTQWNRLYIPRKLSNADQHQEPVTLKTEAESVQSQATVVQNGTKRSDDTSIGALEPVVSHVTTQITEMTADIQALKNTNTRQDQERGTTYMRWGHTDCPDSSELVYTGIIGGTHHSNAGGPANHLCLTSQPVFDGHVQPSGNYYTYIYGSEYEICPETECDTTPACAVCRVSRAASVMIPGTNTCSPGWTKEYSGYIMADHPGDHPAASEYICIDSSRKHAVSSSQSADNQNVMYYTHTRCGALPCPPYQNDKVLTCVVCTK